MRTDQAARDIRKKKTEYISDAAQRQRIGQIEDAQQSAEYSDVLQQEADLTAGHGILRTTGLIAVSAQDPDELERAVADIEQAAIQASCETRRLWGQQAQAFSAAALAALPTGLTWAIRPSPAYCRTPSIGSAVMQSWGTAPPPSVIIDLSPIVLLRGEPTWGWVDATVKAWREQRDPKARFYGVADNSLWYRLDDSGRRSLSNWKRKRMARSVSWADPEVLELATEFDTASVLTTDLYRDHRREFPWLQGTDRVWKPVPSNGTIAFEQLDYTAIAAEEVSWRIEEADLTPKGFRTPEARDALRYEWRCTAAACQWSAKAVIEEDPAFRDGQVVCPGCLTPARQLGLRESTKEIVLLLGDDEVDRLPLAERSELTVGRGRDAGRYDVREVLDDADANKISRDHLKLSNNGGRIFVEELGSKNGTQILRPDGAAAPLQVDVQQILAPTEQLALAGGSLNIRLSGKKRPRGTYEPDLTTPPFLRLEGN